MPWLTRAYFVAYTAGQVLPTSLGGDAVRVVETTRRHPGRATVVTGTVLLERGLGGAATVALGAIGFLLSIGDTTSARTCGSKGCSSSGRWRSASSSSRARRGRFSDARSRCSSGSASTSHCAASTKASITTAAVRACSGRCVAVSFCVQAVRILAIWAAARAVGIDLDPRIYYVFGPLLFLVMLVPFTLNGLAVREAFFVSFLGSVGVGADQAFAAGFLYFLVTLLLAFPGALIMLREGLAGRARAPRSSMC